MPTMRRTDRPAADARAVLGDDSNRPAGNLRDQCAADDLACSRDLTPAVGDEIHDAALNEIRHRLKHVEIVADLFGGERRRAL